MPPSAKHLLRGIAFFCMLCFLFTGCHKPALTGLTTSTVRCVFVENHTNVPLVFQISVNTAPPDTQIIEPGRGLFLYEPLADRTDANASASMNTSITAPDKSMNGGSNLFAGNLSAILTNRGNITGSGWSGGQSPYGEPTAQWLSDNHLEARLIHNLRSVIVTFSKVESPAP